MQSFKRLTVWERAHELTLQVFRCTDGPMARRYPTLSAQMRRVVAAIPSAIAEGAGHATTSHFHRALEQAIASTHEAQYLLLLAKDLAAITLKQYATLEARLGVVTGMLYRLRSRIAQPLRVASASRGTHRPERK